MKVLKTIENGKAQVEVELTDREDHAMSGVFISSGMSTWTTRTGDFGKGGFAKIRAAAYAGVNIAITEITELDCSTYTPEKLLSKALANYEAIIRAKQAAHAMCGTAELVSKQTALEFLSGENRLYYRNRKGQITPVE